MKNINLINPIQPHQQQEINRWYISTIALSSITSIALISYTVHQVKQNYQLKKQKSSLILQTTAFDTTTNELTKIKKEHQELQTRLDKITNATKKTGNLSAQLQEISRIIPNDVHLESLVVDERNALQMSGFGSGMQTINDFLMALTTSSLFKNIQLTLLQAQKGTGKQHPSFYFKISQST